MPKDISRLSPSFSSGPGCLQEAHRGHRRALATRPVLNGLWGEDAALGSCTEEPWKTLKRGEGMGFPKSLRDSGGHLPSQPPLLNYFLSSSQGRSLRSPGRAKGPDPRIPVPLQGQGLEGLPWEHPSFIKA